MKSKFTVLLLVMLLSGAGLAVVDTANLGNVQATTTVPHTIVSDTTWTKADGPYNLIKNVIIPIGVTLTIQPGVTVNLSHYSIIVNGSINARGSSTEQITFYGGGGYIDLTLYSQDWNEQSGTGCIFENCIFQIQRLNVASAAKIENNRFTGAGIWLQLITNAQILDNTFTNGKTAISVSLDYVASITGASIVGNTIFGYQTAFAVDGTSKVVMPNNTITTTIESNLIYNNDLGLSVGGWKLPATYNTLIQNNAITNNTIGLYMHVYESELYATPKIQNNNIYGNIKYNAQIGLKYNINVINNWWGTADAAEIGQTIYDYNDDPTDPDLGTINYVPFLTAANPSAPTAPSNSPTSTPTPFSSITPSSSNQTIDPSMFQFTSNSTIDAMAFDAQNSELSFTVSGDAGTTGTTTVSIAKNILSNTDTVKVFVDGNQINYDLSETGDAWLFTFSYSHSTHQVRIDLNASPETEFLGIPLLGWIFAVVVIASVLALLLAVVFKRKPKVNKASP